MAVLSAQFWCIGNWSKVYFAKKTLKIGNLYKVLVFRQFKGPFLHEYTDFSPNPSSNLKMKFDDSKICEISKSTLGLYIFLNNLTLHPYNSKSSLPTTGTFRNAERYVERLSSIVNGKIYHRVDRDTKRISIKKFEYRNIAYSSVSQKNLPYNIICISQTQMRLFQPGRCHFSPI